MQPRGCCRLPASGAELEGGRQAAEKGGRRHPARAGLQSPEGPRQRQAAGRAVHVWAQSWRGWDEGQGRATEEQPATSVALAAPKQAAPTRARMDFLKGVLVAKVM